MVTKLDRLARSVPDARAIADELTARQISLSLGGWVYHCAIERQRMAARANLAESSARR